METTLAKHLGSRQSPVSSKCQVVTENHSHEDSEVKHKQRLTQHEIVSVNAIVSSPDSC